MSGVFRALAEVLSPIDADRPAVIDLDRSWRPMSEPSGGEWGVWGRLPGRGLSATAAIRFAVRREVAIRRLGRGAWGLRVRRLHRLPPARHAGGGRAALRRALLQGAVAELSGSELLVPAYEMILREAQVAPDPIVLLVSRDGSARIEGMRHGAAVVVRMGAGVHGTDPARPARALDLLEGRGIAPVPRLFGAGRHGTVGWSVESRLPGRSPGALTAATWGDALAFLASLVEPSPSGRGRAVEAQARALGGMLPGYRDRILRAAQGVSPIIAAMPSVVQHGDFFLENLLVGDGRLTGVIDWATWAEGGTPGIDLLELYTSARARRGAGQFSAILAGETWRSQPYLAATSAYWPAVGVDPTQANLRAIAVAWWLNGVTTLLARPDRADLRASPDWLSREVDSALDWISGGNR